MTDKFRRVPHWQLFLCSFGLPFLAQLLGTGMSLYYLSAEPDAAQPDWPRYVSSVGSLAIAGVLYGWMWSVGAGLQANMPREFRRSVVGFSVVLTLLATVCVASLFLPGSLLLFDSTSNTFTVLFWTLLPLLAVWMGAHLYGASYVADIIITAEEEREPTAHELIRLSLLVWLFPVGVWTVQPRVNRLNARAAEPVASGEIGQSIPLREKPVTKVNRPLLQD